MFFQLASEEKKNGIKKFYNAVSLVGKQLALWFTVVANEFNGIRIFL